jgi:hypothetical protein
MRFEALQDPVWVTDTDCERCTCAPGMSLDGRLLNKLIYELDPKQFGRRQFTDARKSRSPLACWHLEPICQSADTSDASNATEMASFAERPASQRLAASMPVSDFTSFTRHG